MDVSQNVNFTFLAIFAISGILVSILTPIMKIFAIKKNIIDYPNQAHKTHIQPVPYLGGLSIIFTTIIVSSFSLWIFEVNKEYLLKILIIILPSLVLSTIGLFDDIRNLSAYLRLFYQLVLSVAVTGFLIISGYSITIFSYTILNILFSVIWFVALTNAFNFVDNMDGQLASLALVSNFFLFILSYRQDQFLIAALAITISGASFAFLFWNWNPASIYLGDSGSLFLGVLMATSLLQYEPAFESFWVNLSVPIFLVAIPLIDISVATLSRILQKRSVLQGGHDHLSHILFRKFKSKSMSVLFLVLLQFAFCSIAFLVEISTGEFAEIISRIGLLGLFSITIFFLAVSKPEVSSHK